MASPHPVSRLALPVGAQSAELAKRARPDPADRAAGAVFLSHLRGDPIGWWSGDRAEQVNHFRDTVYVAIQAYMDAVSSATVYGVRRNPHPDSPGGDHAPVRKALPTPHAQARDEEYTPLDPSHPLSAVLERPGGAEGRWTMGEELSYLAMQVLLTGEAPAWCVPNADGKPVQFFALPSALTYPLYQRGVNPQYPEGAWRVQAHYATGGWGYVPPGVSSQTILPGEEVHRFVNRHAMFRWAGWSPLSAGARTIDILEGVDQSRWAAMDHGTQLDAVLFAPGMDPAEAERFQRRMEEKHGGARNARRVGVITPPPGSGDKFDLKPFSVGAREMDYVGSWDQCVGAVTALFGVPKTVANLATATSYAELYAALRQFHTLKLKPFAKRMSDFLTRALADPWAEEPGELKVQIDLPTLDDPDLQERQLSLDTQVGGITYNEYRALRQRAGEPDGDVPISVYLAKKTQEVAPPPQPAPGDGEGEGDPFGDSDDDAGGGSLDELLGSDTPTAGAPPRPDNDAAQGTGLPRVKSLPFDEAKHKRDHGKFSATQGASGESAPKSGAGAPEPAPAPKTEPVSIAGHDHFRGKLPAAEQVPARPKSKKARDQIGRAVHDAWVEARNALAAKYGTREINDRMSPEEQKAESDLHSTLRVLTSGNEYDGPFDLGPVSDQRYAGYYRAALLALDRLRASAATTAKALDGCAANTMAGSAGGFLVPEGGAKRRGRFRRVYERKLKELEGGR